MGYFSIKKKCPSGTAHERPEGKTIYFVSARETRKERKKSNKKEEIKTNRQTDRQTKTGAVVVTIDARLVWCDSKWSRKASFGP